MKNRSTIEIPSGQTSAFLNKKSRDVGISALSGKEKHRPAGVITFINITILEQLLDPCNIVLHNSRSKQSHVGEVCHFCPIAIRDRVKGSNTLPTGIIDH